MIRSCLLFAAVFQVIFGQAEEGPPQPLPPSDPRNGYRNTIIPHYCLSPPPGTNIRECCPVPKLFPDEEMERCGIDKLENQPKGPPQPRVPCKESICLLQNANILLANQSIDYEKMRAFVDTWAEANPEFTESILEAKKLCAKDGGPKSPPVCEHDRIFFCLTTNVLWNCKLRDGEGCQILKSHMDECRPYYWHQRAQEETTVQSS